MKNEAMMMMRMRSIDGWFGCIIIIIIIIMRSSSSIDGGDDEVTYYDHDYHR